MIDPWGALDAALDRAAVAGRPVDFWWRDDDAVTTTGALDRLAALSRQHACPLLLAVIPASADRHLAAFVAAEALITPTQHGFAHTNHAGLLQRACELGGARPRDIVLAELQRGRDRMTDLFTQRRTDILVPPWNRIAPDLLPHLPDLGFGALSTFAALHLGTLDLDIVNCGLDIIDWRNGRRCHRETKLVDRLAGLVEAGGPIGLLTHHLVHDDEAWAFVSRALTRLSAHPIVRFTSADRIRSEKRPGATPPS